MENGPERLAVIARMRAIMNEDCSIILHAHPMVFSLAQPWTKRISGNQMARNSLKYAVIDPVLRDKKIEEWNTVSLTPLIVTGVAILGVALAGIQIGRKRNV
jgi:hypothetical protein